MEERVILQQNTVAFDFDCSICMCMVETPVVTQCGHLFCWVCLYGWSTKSAICPVCKSPCSISSVIPLYSKGSLREEKGAAKVPRPLLLNPSNRMVTPHGPEYRDSMRMLQVDGMHYQQNTHAKHCIFTRIFYVALILFCMMLIVFLD